mmetsp:Transcript_26736/g.40608  ORF Transcript_26736/g.40608 Transcript_26736/m.40608 type:complete len:624 (-) Transcript_26736:26-1897(-)
MAEQVQSALDKFVAPLKDLLDRGVFSEEEIKTIVSRRREHEYLLRRRVARQADFLRYIEDEMTLEKLRKLRTKRINQRQERKKGEKVPERKRNGGLPVGDVHIIQLIHLLFVRVIRKFRSDVSLHLQHAAFAKESKSYNKLNTIYTEALQVHPRNIGLWIEAASYEFFGYTNPDTGEVYGGGSIQGARVLMQRGLRINATSQDLWVQYFCLELHYIQKLRGRREILQLSSQEETEEPFFADAPIPTIVYKNAINSIPSDVAFRMKFLDLCSSFPQTDKIEKCITTSIEADFSDQPEAWIARAMYVVEKEKSQTKNEELDMEKGFLVVEDETYQQPSKRQRINGTPPVLKILNEAIKALPIPDMYLRAIKFARQCMNQNLYTDEVIQQFMETLLGEIEFNTLTCELVLEQSEYLKSIGKVEKAIQCVKDFLLSNPLDVPASLQLAKLFKINTEVPEATIELRRSLKHVPVNDPLCVKVLLELFGAMMSSECRLVELKSVLEKILLLAPNNNPTFKPAFGVGSVAEACLCYLQKSADDQEIKNAICLVAESSTYCDCARDKSDEEIQMMVSFFDEAFNKLSATESDKRRNRIFHRLFDKAIQFFKACAPELSDMYCERKNEYVHS